MQQPTNDLLAQVPIGDFFGWKHHPFADTYKQHQLWIPPRDSKQLETIKRLLHTGKSRLYVVLPEPVKRLLYMP